MSLLDETNGSFVADLKESDRYVRIVATWLDSLGYKTDVHGLRIRPDPEVRAQYADDGDLTVVVNGESERCEVKHRRLDFTSHKEFPFFTVLVDVAHSWDNADPKPLAYFILNRSCTHAFVIHAETQHQWERRRRYDSHIDRTRWYVECPKDRCDLLEVGKDDPFARY
jgi:hypothetical protein